MGFYSKYILPRLLDITMRSDVFESHRRSVVERAKGTALEIGSGSGLNFPYYRNVEKLYALEPSKEMHALAKDSIEELSFSVVHLESGAERVPLPDRSVDAVVSTWTFCTILHPEEAMREIRRVLKPGGVFSFIEHGISPRPYVSRLQKIITPGWKRMSGGCHLDRDIQKLLIESGLKIEHMERFPMKWKPLNFMYKGVARN